METNIEDMIFLPQEVEEGNVEYKRALINPTPERLDKLTSQLKWRLFEGNGEALYEIGVDDDGSPYGLTDAELNASIANLREIASRLNCEVSQVCTRKGIRGRVAEMLVREVNDAKYQDIRIAVCGNVDAGKSTLIGTLTTNNLDNGRGLTRVSCFRHEHEVITGRTSSIGYQLMGFNAKGECVNDNALHKMTWGDIMRESYKVITFLDLAGHEKYIKTTISGMSGHLPDYALLVVGANMGVSKMTREHFRLTLALRIPVIVVITKVDICPENIYKHTMQDIKQLLKQANKRTLNISSTNDLVTSVKSISTGAITPIFSVSSVTGENLNLVRSFLNMLSPRIQWDQMKDKPAEVLIDEIYHIKGTGTVVTGIVLSGTIRRGKKMLLGPFGNGTFKEVSIRTIQTNRVPVSQVSAGASAGFALPKVKRNTIRKGMVLAEIEAKPKPIRVFEAKIVILHHSTTIRKNYQPVIQCMSIRQAARIMNIHGKDILRTGDRATVKFRFNYRPECISEGLRIILKEGNCKAIGVITKVYDINEEAVSENMEESFPLNMGRYEKNRSLRNYNNVTLKVKA